MKLTSPAWPCALALIGALALTACGRSGDQPGAAPAPASSPTAGVTPSSIETPAASDRPGRVVEGAVEAGQASGGAVKGSAAAPTGGDAAPGSSPAAASAAQP